MTLRKRATGATAPFFFMILASVFLEVGPSAYAGYDIQIPQIQVQFETSDGQPVEDALIDVTMEIEVFGPYATCPRTGRGTPPGACWYPLALSNQTLKTGESGSVWLAPSEFRSRSRDRREKVAGGFYVLYQGIDIPACRGKNPILKVLPQTVTADGVFYMSFAERVAICKDVFGIDPARAPSILTCKLPISDAALHVQIELARKRCLLSSRH